MDYQATLPEYDVPVRVISYLSNCVRGNVISDARIIDYDGRFKDYKAGDVKTFKLERGEFVRRLAMNSLPLVHRFTPDYNLSLLRSSEFAYAGFKVAAATLLDAVTMFSNSIVH